MLCVFKFSLSQEKRKNDNVKKIKDVIIQVVAKHYNGQIMNMEQYKLPTDLILDIKSRLKTLSGQINGIVKMLDEGKDPEQINIQFM